MKGKMTPHIICKSTQFKNHLYYGVFSASENSLILYVGYNDNRRLYVFSDVFDYALIEPFKKWLEENNFKIMLSSDLAYEMVCQSAKEQYLSNPKVMDQNQIAMLTALLLVDDANKEVQLHETDIKVKTVTCKNNEGMEAQFDKGVEYKLISDGKLDGEKFIIVEDAMGEERRVFKDRFEFKD